MEIQESRTRTRTRNNMESREITTDRMWKAFFTSSHAPLTVIVITLLLGVGLGIIIPYFISNVYILTEVNKFRGILGTCGLVYALWKAFDNWKQIDRRARPLFGAGIAAIITLSLNSLSFGVWTLLPLAVPGWLISGVIASPLLLREPGCQTTKEKISYKVLEKQNYA
jgi:hypothetical protein